MKDSLTKAGQQLDSTMKAFNDQNTKIDSISIDMKFQEATIESIKRALKSQTDNLTKALKSQTDNLTKAMETQIASLTEDLKSQKSIINSIKAELDKAKKAQNSVPLLVGSEDSPQD